MALDQCALSAMATELSQRFDSLCSSCVLTARLRPALDEVTEYLPTLVSGVYPLGLTHSDLNKLNILVDSDSGIITGVVDWADAGIQPFGLILYALEGFVGSMGRDGWAYFDNASTLRDEFWRTFAHYAGQVPRSQMKSIRVARNAGYLLRYGTPYIGGQNGGCRD